MVRKTQFDNGIILSSATGLMELPIPVGILPIGASNIVANTAHGSTDLVTAALHIIFGEFCLVTL